MLPENVHCTSALEVFSHHSKNTKWCKNKGNTHKTVTVKAPKPSKQFTNLKVLHQIEANRTNDKASQLIKAHSSKCRGHIGLLAKQMNNTSAA